MYGKQTECAVAAVSRLAEAYDGGKTRLSATEIADSRGLQRPFVAKILNALSQAGLVSGSRGPGGGFTLTRSPKRIKVYDVYKLFERNDDTLACPFGGGVCGVGDECPLHERLSDIQSAMDRLIHGTTFEVFRAAYQDEGRRPTEPAKRKVRRKRDTYRAPRSR